MIIATTTRTIAALLLAGLSPTTALLAQDVYLSEIQADPNDMWIEVHNRGANTIDISSWSLHYASKTPGMPNNYWWPFPLGTTLAPDAFLRVHWFQPEPALAIGGNLYTGTSPYGFLFGLGGEPLSGSAGAAALFASQANLQMNSSATVRDWVSWGDEGFQREGLAIAAGLWTTGRAAATIPGGASLARDPEMIGATNYQDETWFVDYTPTPLLPNVTGAVVESYGTACTLPGNHLLGLPELRTTSQPLLGNAQFSLAVDRTTGIFGEYVLVGFSPAAAPPGLPSILPAYAGMSCSESIDTTAGITTWLLPASILSTPIPLPLNNYPQQVLGVELHVQALVIELLPAANPPYQGISNALRIVVGQ